jgi:hypothetical protein
MAYSNYLASRNQQGIGWLVSCDEVTVNEKTLKPNLGVLDGFLFQIGWIEKEFVLAGPGDCGFNGCWLSCWWVANRI